MEELTLRKCPGGYKRDDVNHYVASLVAKYEKEIADAQKEAENARCENAALTKQNAELFRKVEQLEADRDSVSRAVIAAQQQADLICEEAKRKGDALLQEKAEEVAQTERTLQRLQGEIRSLRLAATAAIRKYERELNAISVQDDEDEDI